MKKITIYLDNCCFNRPYDDQKQERIYLESLAKLYIQQLITDNKIDFIWSYILEYENQCQQVKQNQQLSLRLWKNLAIRGDGLRGLERSGLVGTTC